MKQIYISFSKPYYQYNEFKHKYFNLSIHDSSTPFKIWNIAAKLNVVTLIITAQFVMLGK